MSVFVADRWGRIGIDWQRKLGNGGCGSFVRANRLEAGGGVLALFRFV